MTSNFMETDVYPLPDFLSVAAPGFIDFSSKGRANLTQNILSMDCPLSTASQMHYEHNKSTPRQSCECCEVKPGSNCGIHRAAVISRGSSMGTASTHKKRDSSADSAGISVALEGIQHFTAFIIDEPDKAYAQYMQTSKVYDVIPVNTKFVVLDTELSVRKAFYALIYNGVRSALLWSSQDEQFCGLFTVTDFINILIHTYKNAPDGKIKNIEDQLIKEWRELLNRQNKLKPLLYINVDDTLLNATKKLISARFHRIPIFDDAGVNALHFLTHKRILRYLCLVMDKLPTPSFMACSVRSLGVGTFDDLLTVDQSTPLIECLQRLTSRNLSALPVLDGSGVVVDIYARFDAIAVAAEGSYDMLHRPICEMLAHRRKSKWYKGVITCLESDSLKSVIDKLYIAEVHGLVVVSKERKLRGVITLFDILKFIIVDQIKF